jgi:hypothetical protein
MRRLREELQRSLFRASPEAGRRGGWEVAFPVAAFLILASALQLLRLDPEEALDSLWAEDGQVFLPEAMGKGLVDNLTSTYAEYLGVVPRLIAELGDLVPIPDAALAMALAGTLTISLSGLVVWFASAAHIRSPYLRGLLVALTVLSPVASLEAVVSGTYAPWYMSFAVFWLLLWRPRTTWSACLGGAFILLTGLSIPTIFFFVPLAALRAIAVRDERDAILVGAFGLALAIQLPVTASSDEHLVDAVWTEEIWTVLMQRVVDGSVLGLELGGDAWSSWGWPFLIGLTVAVALYLAVLAFRASSGRLLAAIAVLTSVGMFAVSMYQRAATGPMQWYEEMSNGLGGRYAIVPSLLLISAVLVLLDDRVRSRSRAWLGAAVATGAVLLVALVTSFDTGAPRTGPSWRDAVEAGAERCRAEGLPVAVVYTAPRGAGALYPCEELETVSATDPPAASP